MRWRRRSYFYPNRYRSRKSSDGAYVIVLFLIIFGVSVISALLEIFLQLIVLFVNLVIRYKVAIFILFGVIAALVIYRIIKDRKKKTLNGSSNTTTINERGYVVLSTGQLQHRHIAETVLKRRLHSNEVVHHLNGIRSDNRPENLCVMDHEKHEHLHAWLKWKKEKTGHYPTFREIQRVARGQYSGILLIKISD